MTQGSYWNEKGSLKCYMNRIQITANRPNLSGNVDRMVLLNVYPEYSYKFNYFLVVRNKITLHKIYWHQL